MRPCLALCVLLAGCGRYHLDFRSQPVSPSETASVKPRASQPALKLQDGVIPAGSPWLMEVRKLQLGYLVEATEPLSVMGGRVNGVTYTVQSEVESATWPADSILPSRCQLVATVAMTLPDKQRITYKLRQSCCIQGNDVTTEVKGFEIVGELSTTQQEWVPQALRSVVGSRQKYGLPFGLKVP